MTQPDEPFEPDHYSEDELRALIHEAFAIFVQVMYAALKGSPLLWAPYLDLLASRLADIAHGRRRRLIITMPPRYGKSFCVSVALPAFFLGHYPASSVMCVSYGQALAPEFARDCLSLMLSSHYTDVFGDVLDGKRQPLEAIRTRHGGVRRATSLLGVSTGVGADLLIFDDPQKPGETLSDAIRRSTNEAFERTFYSRRTPPTSTRIIIVMQRLHEDDFVGHVRSRGGEWDILNFPAIAEEDESAEYTDWEGSKLFHRKEGEALNPAYVPISELEDTRRVVGEAMWATQYQQRPTPVGGGVVNTGAFKRYTDKDVPERFDRIVQSWDTANKVAEWNDYSVCTTWGVKGKHLYLLHVFRQRLEFKALYDAAVAQASLQDADEVYIEDQASGTQLIQSLRSAGFGWVRAYTPSRDKKVRMRNQGLLIGNGFVHVPVEAPWLHEYLHELAVFPHGRFDDQADSTSQALDAIANLKGDGAFAEYVRQELQAMKPKADDMIRLRPPPPQTMMTDQEGVEHWVKADGCFHLTRKQAGVLVNAVGWKVEPWDE